MGNTSPHVEMTVPDLLAEADRLADDGQGLDAIRRLTEANRSRREPQVEERLVMLRHDVFPSLPRRPVETLAPEVVREEPNGALAPTDRPDLDVATLRRELARHGCVLVRGLIPPERAEAMARGIDRALEAFDGCEASGVAGRRHPGTSPSHPRALASSPGGGGVGCGPAAGCGRPTRPACCSS